MRSTLTKLLALALAAVLWGPAFAQQKKPNILVIWGDDIGYWNLSAYNQGMMGYKTPNIDRIAKEGALFTDWYGQQSCTAGRAAFITGRDANVDWKRYDKVLIERISVYVKPGAKPNPIDPTDLKMLLDYFHNALVKAITPEAQIVNTAGPGVLRMRIALTELTPTNTMESLAGTAVPYGFVAEIGSGAATGRPAGSTPYMGDTGMAVQFRDGGSGRVVAECADNEIGRKYAADLNQGVAGAAVAWANGYVESFTSWSYAKDALDKWTALFARRFAELRGMKPTS